ncbi:MAG: thiamine phosphate synthase [Pontiellaceae bacterium]|nr:thiamine phosphate synthase [Kiritimatiellaceae bacterium]
MHQLNGLYLILTNPVVGYEAAARAAVNCHVSMLQLRMKDETNDQQLEIAQTLRTITQGTQTQLIINDNLPLAQRVEADGLHLGQDDLTLQDARQQYRGIIGISTHNLEQAQAAQAAGADYIGIGPIYATQSKSNPDPVVGIDEGSRIAAAVSCPSVAIGGIQIEKLATLRQHAFTAFCVLSALNKSSQSHRIIQQLQQAWQDAEV